MNKRQHVLVTDKVMAHTTFFCTAVKNAGLAPTDVARAILTNGLRAILPK